MTRLAGVDGLSEPFSAFGIFTGRFEILPAGRTCGVRKVTVVIWTCHAVPRFIEQPIGNGGVVEEFAIQPETTREDPAKKSFSYS